MSKHRIIPILLSCFGVLAATAQDRTFIGLLPNIQVDETLAGQVNYFFQLGSESFLLERYQGDTRYPRQVLTLDLTTGIHFDAGPEWNVAFSVLARRRAPFTDQAGAEFRPWQQLTHIARFGKYRLRNRLRVEQRFIQAQKNDDFAFDLRLRYRLSLDFPLAGERLDNREFYFNSSAEWLLTPSRPRPFFYHNPRAYLGLGYRFNAKNRLETGPEFRTRNVDEEGNDQHIWYWRMTWVVSL